MVLVGSGQSTSSAIIEEFDVEIDCMTTAAIFNTTSSYVHAGCIPIFKDVTLVTIPVTELKVGDFTQSNSGFYRVSTVGSNERYAVINGRQIPKNREVVVIR